MLSVVLLAGCGASGSPTTRTPGSSDAGLAPDPAASVATDGDSSAASGSPSSPPAASSAPTKAAAIPLPDACALVTADDLAPLINHSVKAMPNADAVFDPASQSACSYVVDSGSSGALLLLVTDPGSIDGLVAGVAAKPVDDLGDRAYQWDVASTHTLVVAVGPIVLLAQLSTRFYPADITSAMARIALSRISA